MNHGARLQIAARAPSPVGSDDHYVHIATKPELVSVIRMFPPAFSELELVSFEQIVVGPKFFMLFL
jgi:hypothetical protein